MPIPFRLVVLLAGAALVGTALHAKPLADFASLRPLLDGKGIDIVDTSGRQLRLRAYGESMIRIQAAGARQQFLPDDHYQMIERHDFGGALRITEQNSRHLVVSNGRINIAITKKPLRLTFSDAATGRVLLADRGGIDLGEQEIAYSFTADPAEHFIGFGQKRLALQDGYLLRGQTERRNYGEEGYPGRGSQGVLCVPFHISSKGYGLYANTTYPNEGRFGVGGTDYSLRFETLDPTAQADYVFILGPAPATILDHYTQLTGRPRLPTKSIFGIHLSDNDPRLPDNLPIDQNWWKTMVANHRAAGFPLDHIVFDNDWRAASPLPGGIVGQWGGSQFDWDPTRYPSPPDFRKWCDAQGVTLTLDLNLNNCNDSAGWKPKFNLKPTDRNDSVDAPSQPDFSNPAARRWIWELFWTKSFNPALGYPGDAIWLDEPDGLWAEPDHRLANDRTWQEMKNYYFFLYAQAVTGEGWDNTDQGPTPGIGESKRPHVWIRGGTPGMQRYASHWTGDIDFTGRFYRGQIYGMHSSGLAGFPFYNHDAGGFGANKKDPTSEGSLEGPNDTFYVQWGMALGSFTPIWRPHGYGYPRWPLNRNALCQEAFLRYARLRYELMPYLYTLAHLAHAQGLPMARPLTFVYPAQPEAWLPENQLPYHWGDAFLVIPPAELVDRDLAVKAWFPPAPKWYDFWNDTPVPVPATGGEHTFTARFGFLPLFVRSGSIIPRQNFALSTAWLADTHLTLDVYTGADGSFTLVEDDGITERFRTRGELRKTRIDYRDGPKPSLVVHPAQGTYESASTQRTYTIRIHGLKTKPTAVHRNGQHVDFGSATAHATSATWSCEPGLLTLCIPPTRTGATLECSWSIASVPVDSD